MKQFPKRRINSYNFLWRVYYWVNNNVGSARYSRTCLLRVLRAHIIHRSRPILVPGSNFVPFAGRKNSPGREGGGGMGEGGGGEDQKNDTFHYLMRGTWLDARQLSRSCVFHLDNYLGRPRVTHVD